MIRQILTNAGFVEDETFKETRFLKPPRTTYAVFMDSFERRGADNLNLLKDHNGTIELYAYAPDPIAEANIEKSLDDFGLEYDKEPRYWLNSEQIFQTVYNFNFIEK